MASTLDTAAGTQTVNRSSVSALAFLVWDICITMDQEVELVWSQPLAFTKCLYFFMRYIPVAVQCSLLVVGTELSPEFHFTPHDCFIWQVYQGVAMVVIIMAVDYILLLRIDAVYHGWPPIKWAVRILYAGEVICMGIGIAFGLPGIKYDSICAVIMNETPQALVFFGMACIVFQIILFVLTAIKFVAAFKAGWGNVPLMELLMRDGTWALLLLLAIVLGNGILALLHNHAYIGILFGWLLTAFSFVGYRVILNLRHMDTPLRSRESRGGAQVTKIAFAAGSRSLRESNLSTSVRRDLED